MSKSRNSMKLDIGIRIGGLFLLALGACAMKLLYGQVHTPPAHEASPSEIFIGAIGFLSLSGGAMLATLGHHILDPVAISARWSTTDRNLL